RHVFRVRDRPRVARRSRRQRHRGFRPTCRGRDPRVPAPNRTTAPPTPGPPIPPTLPPGRRSNRPGGSGQAAPAVPPVFPSSIRMPRRVPVPPLDLSPSSSHTLWVCRTTTRCYGVGDRGTDPGRTLAGTAPPSEQPTAAPVTVVTLP